MNIENKKRIIDNLLENKFNVENFKDFVTNILNLPVKNRKPYESIYKVFREYIETYQEIAETTDKDGSKFYVLAVKIKNERDPERARIKQREFIANMLRERKKRGALVAFFNDDYSHWRISFVKLDFEFTVKGIKENITPAKRLSYVVGEGEACKTPKDQFFLLSKLENEVSLKELEEIFALEKVTNDFFKEYKEKYLDIKELLIKDATFMKEAQKHDIENPESFAEGFSKKLMGQLAFLYFLQKKGWLGAKIVPETLDQQQFDRFYNRALNKEKEVLEKVYNKVSSNLYELRKDELNQILTDEEIDLIAGPFRNTEYFNEWGTGDKKFIRNLFEYHKLNDKDNGKNFFDDYLEVLFYNNLSKERGEIQYSIDFNCRIPFLNGGLFDPYGDYDWEATSFNLSDDIFSNKDKTGILDIFDIYNFTINENDSYETEVAVDPEMLGKVFENLLDVSDRKSKGAFYTPREIVRYMTNESIMNYLLTNLEGKDITKDDLEYLFSLGEFTKEYDQQIFEKDYLSDKKPLEKDIFGMPRNIITNSKLIDELLIKVKIADPACGSGAFPLGILNEIVRARNVLTFYINMIEVLKEKDEKNYWKRIDKKQKERKLYKLKLETIQNCLYGVDIEPSAIDITKLRLWLSIIVDSDNNNVRPLPNLDFNFMIGNSLIDEFEGMKLFDESLLNEVEEEGKLEQKQLIKESKIFQSTLFKTDEERKQDILKVIFKKQAEYFNERNSEKKKELKREIEEFENFLIETTLRLNRNEKKLEEIKKGRKERRKPYFLWKLEFAKVFRENGGFNIVIGNPPYGAKFSKEEKKLLAKNFPTVPDYESYYYFIELSLNLLKSNGILAYINPNMFMANNFAKDFRKTLLTSFKIIKVDDLSNINVFESAKVRTCIIIFKKNCLKDSSKIEFNIPSLNMRGYQITSTKVLNIDILENNLDNWLNLFYINPEILLVLNKIKLYSLPLKEISEVSQGLIPYDKYRGHSEEIIKNRIWHSEFKKDDTYKKELKGADVTKYNVQWNGKLWISYGEWLAAPRKPEFFKTPRILIREITNPNILACYTEEEYYNTPSIINVINIKKYSVKYVLGILNSKLLSFYHINSSPKAKKGLFPKILVNDVRNLPIYDKESPLNSKIINLVDRIIELKKLDKDTQDLEVQVDEMVYDLYELTEEEKELVRGF